MALFVSKTKKRKAVACFAAALLFGASVSCFAQTDDAASASASVSTPADATGPASSVPPEPSSPTTVSAATARAEAAAETPAVASAPAPASAPVPPLALDSASEVPSDPHCASVILACNTPLAGIAPAHPLTDAATARDQAQRAQAQANQAAAEQDLQRRIEFARQHPDAIFVYGDKSTPKESVSDVFNRALGVTSTSLTTSTFDSMGRRTECINECHGPLCCVTTH